MLQKKKDHSDITTPWENDYLETKKIAEYLTPVIDSIQQPFVISLNAPFGSGKTFLIRNWQKELSDKNYNAVYFNAWESDYSDNALIAFIYSMEEQLKGAKKNYKSLATNGAAYIAKKTLPLLAKGVAAKFIGKEAVDAIADVATLKEDDITKLASALVENSLENHKAVTKSVQNFKKELTKFIASDGMTDSEAKNKLIIFVDELDRCRPTYAIEILECINHLFDVPGIVFVLAIDSEQLKATIHKTYGTADGGEGYLRKFIDWQINLPKPTARAFARKLYDDFNLQETNKLAGNYDVLTGYQSLIAAIGLVADLHNLTPRQIAQIFTDINLYIRTLPKNETPFSFALGIVASLRHAIPLEELSGYCRGKDDYEDFVQRLIQRADSKIFASIAGWDKAVWKANLTSIFIDNKIMNQLDKEWETLRRRTDAEKATSDDTARYEYLNKIFVCMRPYANHVRNIGAPVVWAVSTRLEKTSFLSELNG